MVKKLVKYLRKGFTNSYAQPSTRAIVNHAVYLDNSLLLFVLQAPATCNIQRFGDFAATSVLISCTYLIIIDTIKRPLSQDKWPNGTKAQEAWERIEWSFSVDVEGKLNMLAIIVRFWHIMCYTSHAQGRISCCSRYIRGIFIWVPLQLN